LAYRGKDLGLGLGEPNGLGKFRHDAATLSNTAARP
jgi:hypothetical protein